MGVQRSRAAAGRIDPQPLRLLCRMSLPPSEHDSAGQRAAFDEELPKGSVSVLAVVGLGLGCCSLTAIFDSVLWLLPPLAIGVNLFALRLINRYWPGLVGRPIARAGLALAIVGGVAGPARVAARDWLLTTEATHFADFFFTLLRDDKPELAYQLTFERHENLPFGGALWSRYRASAERMDSLRRFVAEPAIRALLELGSGATVRHYRNEAHRRHEDQDVLVRLYAVTYRDESGAPRTFFVRLILTRKRDAYGDYAWSVRAAGPIRPENGAEPSPS